jgi:hypothetical protein
MPCLHGRGRRRGDAHRPRSSAWIADSGGGRSWSEFRRREGHRGYLNLLSPEQRKQSDEYFEGGYWLQPWEVLWTVGACALLLVTGASERMSQWSQRVSRRPWISTPLFVAQILIVLSLLELPWSIYTDFLREHSYGLSEQPFGGWLRDQAVITIVNAMIFGLLLTLVYAAVRKAGARWWPWATGLCWTYRKIKPGQLEEFLFYDHPSGYRRVRAAMIWLKENQSTGSASDAEASAKISAAAVH